MSARPPNILFLLPDQHRPDWLGTNPDLDLNTPHLDRLGASGMRFTRAFCSSPLCAPSRAALASGRSYERCGVINNGQNYPLDLPTYYQSLRDRGYRVAGVGKFDLHKLILDWGLDGKRDLAAWGLTDGIDNEGKCDGVYACAAYGGPRGPYLAYLQERGLADGYLEEHRNRRQSMDAYTSCLPDDAYCDNWLAANGLDCLRGFPQDQPWHLVVNFTGPHNPMEVTASMRESVADRELPMPVNSGHPDRDGLLRSRRHYAAMIENIDRLVGCFLAAVDERGERDRTLVVYSSDHGEMLGDHGRLGKCTWHQPSAGIPLIVSGPGVQRGVTTDTPVVLHDLAATFIDDAQAAALPGMDACSLRPVLEGRTSAHRDVVRCGLNGWQMICDGRYKLVVHADGARRLHDLEEDPWEHEDFLTRCPRIAERLESRLSTECRPDPAPFVSALEQSRAELSNRQKHPPEKLPQARPALEQLRAGFLPLCLRALERNVQAGVIRTSEAGERRAGFGRLARIAQEMEASLDTGSQGA